MLPTARSPKARKKPAAKLLVGLMGSVEIPFVVRLIGKEWKVEPQPYFALINQ